MARILVVDDEEEIVDLLEFDLVARGHTVVTSTSGAGALLELGRSTFDLVITDLMMPHVTGLDICRELARLQPEAEIVLISGFADQEVKLAGNKVAHRLWKPFSLDVLADLVATLVK